MTSKSNNAISLSGAKGIGNYFVGELKPHVMACNRILYATVPFTRNIIEYTRDYKSNAEAKQDYLILTSLLHWKQDTSQITVGDYLKIYNKVFNSNHAETSVEKAIDLIDAESLKLIGPNATHTGLNLEDKVLLSIAIRIKAEKFLTEQIRNIRNEATYWYGGKKNQFVGLFDEYKKEYQQLSQDIPYKSTLEKVGITVNPNIHLNSFMYEPILDLTIDHLIELYKEVSNLNV